MSERALYTFNWNEGGFNSVWASTKKEAIEQIAKEFGTCNLTPNLNTLQRRATRKSQNAYWDSLPLMDQFKKPLDKYKNQSIFPL